MTKTIEDSVHVQNQEKQAKGGCLTHAAWMCAAAVFLTFSYANHMVAQTLVKSNEIYKTQDADGNDGTTSSTTSGTSTAELLDKLQGTDVRYENATSVVTTGRPKANTDDAKKIFLLYNVGTHKFLNLGGYWGTHATLSEVPRFFWLQRRNDGTYTEKTYDSDGKVTSSKTYSNRKDNLWAMVRYPEKDSDGKLCQVLNTDYINPLQNFIAQTTFQVGTAEGANRTNATYKSVIYHKEGIVDVEDSHSNVLKDGVTNPYGRAFAKEFSGNLSDKVIEATIDLSTCHSGKNENVLSIGTNIASTSEGNNLHFYYDGTNFTVKSNNGATVADVTISSTVTSPVDIRLHKNGLYIGSEQVLTADNAIVSSLLSMDASSSAIQIGSQIGDVHSYATYNNLTCTTLAAEGVAENVVTPGYNSNGKKFVKHFPGNLNDYTIEAEIDLSTCKEPQGGWMFENILSIGPNIAADDEDNLHLKYDPDHSNIPFNFKSTAGTVYYPGVENKICKIKLNKEALIINGSTFKVADIPLLQKLLDSSVTELQIGSTADIIGTASCGRSNATYKSLTITKNKKDAEVVDPNVIKPSTSANGEAFFKRFDGNPSTKTITADIDLSTCEEGQEETVFSFGTNIDNETAGDNDIVFHVTYKKGDTKAKYTISGSGENGGGELDVYTLDKNKPTLHFEYKDGKLTYTIWAWAITVTDNFYSILNDADKVKSFVAGSTMGNHSHATYNTFTVEDTSTSSAAKRKSAPARSASRAVGGDEDEILYVSGTDDTKNGYVRSVTGVNFANEGENIEAKIDLSTCTTKLENVFSIGQDIRVWGNSAVLAEEAPDGVAHKALPADQGNLHIYYLGKDETNYKLYVAMVNKDHPDDLKRMVYVPIGQEMDLKLSKNYLEINGTTIYTDHNPMPNIPECSGHEGEIVRFKYADKDNKIFELNGDNEYVIVAPGEAGYDDAHGINATYEGWLYTNESRSDNTSSSNKNMQYFISSDFILDADKLSKNEGNYFGWAPKLPGKDFGSVGVFADRNLPQGDIWNGYSIWHGDTQTSELISADKELAKNSMQWHFHPVTNDWDNTTTYNIYLEMSDIQIPQRSSTETGHIVWQTNKGKKCYYLQATQQDVFGNNQENYYTTNGYDDVTSGTYDGVEALESTVSAASGNVNAQWRLISLEEYLTIFGKSYHEIGANGLLDVSYQLYDPDFKRRNANLDKWKFTGNLATETASDGHSIARVGYDQQIKWIENGKFTGEYLGDVAPNLARYMGVEIKEQDEATGVANGKFYETIKLTKPGWYTIKCAGFTTRDSKLYARYNFTDDTNGTTVKHDLHPLSQDEYNRYSATVLEWPLSGGKQAYNAFALMNDDNLQGEDKTYHENFNSQEVKFFITTEMLQNYSDGVPVEFGVEVDHTKKSETNEKLTFNANYAKTMFDNFHLLYGGNAGNPDLILDENKTNLDYLDKTMHSYRSYTEGNSTQNTKMHLRRTFKENQWNSIILPVGLNKDQFVQAFGSGTKLAKLSKLTKNEILFKTVSDNHDYSYTDKDGQPQTVQYFLEPMTPYIIKFTDGDIVNGSDNNNTEENGYTSRLYYWSKLKPGNDAYIDVNIPKGTPCFTVDNINLLPGVVKTADVPEGSSDEEKAAIDFKWDFADMKESVNSQNEAGSAYNDKKKCPYVILGQGASATDRDDNDVTMTAYGLLAMNVQVDGNGNVILNNNIPTLIEGIPTMSDSYIMQKNALTYKNSKQWNASKAFRCWFEYSKAKPTSQAKPTLLLDGVNMTTGIDNIMDNDEGITPIDQYKKGIFNLGGQLLSKDSADFDKLPKGIYIVDGKKVTKE